MSIINQHAADALSRLQTGCQPYQIGHQLRSIYSYGRYTTDPELSRLTNGLGKSYDDIQTFYSPTQRLLRGLSRDQLREMKRLYYESRRLHPYTHILSEMMLSPDTQSLSILQRDYTSLTESALSAQYFSELFLSMLERPEEFPFQLTTMLRAMPELRLLDGVEHFLSDFFYIPNFSVSDDMTVLCGQSERRLIRAVLEGNACVLTDKDVPMMVYKFDGERVGFMLKNLQSSEGVVSRYSWLVPDDATASEIFQRVVSGDYEINMRTLRSSTWSIARDYNPLNEDHTLGSILNYGPADLVAMVRQRGEKADNNSDRVVRLAGAKNLHFY